MGIYLTIKDDMISDEQEGIAKFGALYISTINMLYTIFMSATMVILTQRIIIGLKKIKKIKKINKLSTL